MERVYSYSPGARTGQSVNYQTWSKRQYAVSHASSVCCLVRGSDDERTLETSEVSWWRMPRLNSVLRTIDKWVVDGLLTLQYRKRRLMSPVICTLFYWLFSTWTWLRRSNYITLHADIRPTKVESCIKTESHWNEYDQMDVWVKLNERKKSEELTELSGLEPVSLMIKKSRLRWFGHVKWNTWYGSNVV